MLALHRHLRAAKHCVGLITMAAAVATKRKAAKIGTHSGTFHCDEALGCFMLKQTNEFKDCGIVRWAYHVLLQRLNCSKTAHNLHCSGRQCAVGAYVADGSCGCRSRDPAVLGDCDVVVDVGGVYEPANNRFDHHQRGFSEAFGNGFSTKLSSAGGSCCGRQCLSSAVGYCTSAPLPHSCGSRNPHYG